MAPLLAERVAVAAADAYTTYLLLGVILFAAKVGQDAADIGHASRKWMPAGGHPEPAAKLVCCDESLGLSATLQDCVLPYFAWCTLMPIGPNPEFRKANPSPNPKECAPRRGLRHPAHGA
mmetsp:Transcript_10798/g.32789  ORF Transcript_10798/g.32789 Transcript_10798/m.32789 type:complete len:120 (+) Transcript_10798:205-564(+)